MFRRSPKIDRADVLAVLLRQREREILEYYLIKYDGEIARTAIALGISRRALERKMLVYNLRFNASSLREKAGIPGPRS